MNKTKDNFTWDIIVIAFFTFIGYGIGWLLTSPVRLFRRLFK